MSACTEAEWTTCNGTCRACPKRTLRYQVEKLMTRLLKAEDRQLFTVALEVAGPAAPLEGLLIPELEGHIRTQYEHLFLADGTPRTPTR